jgi:hypothetical protein
VGICRDWRVVTGARWVMARQRSRTFAQRLQRKGGGKSEKDRGVNWRDAEDAEKGQGEPAALGVTRAVVPRLTPHPS